MENEIPCTPPEIAQKASASIASLVPSKSVGLYEAAYKKFVQWCDAKKVKVYSETVLLAYFSELAESLKSSSLWSRYSMLKLMLNFRHSVDIGKFVTLRAFLKPKKAKTLTKEQSDMFVSGVPDEKYLGTKIILIVGVSGACRCDELVKMKLDDIEDHGNLLFVRIPDSKTNKSRSFTILGELYLAKYRQYIGLRPPDYQERRLFLRYANRKCWRSPLGIHKIGAPKKKQVDISNSEIRKISEPIENQTELPIEILINDPSVLEGTTATSLETVTKNNFEITSHVDSNDSIENRAVLQTDLLRIRTVRTL